MTSPLVSIALTTYNGEKFLKEQLNSLIEQDYENIEIVIVDDCSTDNTFSILEYYANKHPRIRLYRNDINLGLNKNFEKAFSLCKGDFVAISDQDDIWISNKISFLIDHISNHNLIYHDSILIDENGCDLNMNLGMKYKHLYKNKSHSCLNYILRGNIYGHCILVKKGVLQLAVPIPENIIYDYWIEYIASTTTEGIIAVNDYLVKYRQHTTNLYGANTKGNKKKKKKKPISCTPFERIKALYEKCPNDLETEKETLRLLLHTYQSKSFPNNLKRMYLFLKNNDVFLLFKNYSLMRRILFCIKTFIKTP